MSEINITRRSNDSMIKNENKSKEQEESKDLEIIKELKNINLDSKDFISVINDLFEFEKNLKYLNNVNCIFSYDVLDIFQKINEKDNIKMNLILNKIYLNIICNESLYNNYLLFEEKDPKKLEKIDFLIDLIDQCTSLIEKLNGFIFSKELFSLKIKTLDLLKCIYFNCKNKIKNEKKLKILQDLMDTLPPKFYSDAYNELNKNKDLYNIFKSKSLDKVATFEKNFLEINNYYEQYEAFKKFVENNSESIYYKSINEENINKNNENKQIIEEAESQNEYFYQMYGLLLIKFCKCHYYIFLNDEEKGKGKKFNDYQEDDYEKVGAVFLLDKIKKELDLKEKKEVNEEDAKNDEKNLKIENILQNKQFHSIFDSEEYKKLIKKEIHYFLKYTKNLEKNEKIKSLRNQMTYYLNTLGGYNYYPLYLKDFNNITISDSFTPSFIINVPAGKVKKFYLETKNNENMLIYIEFFMGDKSKDINFEINKYDIKRNTFKSIFKREKIGKAYKFFILCNGYSLYEIIFNNNYSWFNSKDIYYKISLLKYVNKPKIELKDGEYYVNLNGKNIIFNYEKIMKKIENKEEERVINIPVILYLNNLRIVFTKKSENHKELAFKEIIEEDETYIPRHVFDYHLISFLKKHKIDTNEQKKIIISIFSQNRELSKISEEIEEKLEEFQDNESKDYIQKIGFIPSVELGEYKVEYKLYDLCEQNLIYHLFLCYKKDVEIEKSILFLMFDKLVVNYAMYYEGNICTNLKGKIEYLDKKNIEEYIFNFIESVNNDYDGVDIVLSHIDYKDEEKKKELICLFENIRKYCEKMNSQVVVYDKNDINNEIFKYINLLYEN